MTAHKVQHHTAGIKLWHWLICNIKTVRLRKDFTKSSAQVTLLVWATERLIWPWSLSANLIWYYHLYRLVKCFCVVLFLFSSPLKCWDRNGNLTRIVTSINPKCRRPLHFFRRTNQNSSPEKKYPSPCLGLAPFPILLRTKKLKKWSKIIPSGDGLWVNHFAHGRRVYPSDCYNAMTIQLRYGLSLIFSYKGPSFLSLFA